MIIFRDVTTIAVIINPIIMPDDESPLVLNASMKALNDAVTNVTRQNKMSKI
jgi:hypothetical protein